LSKSRAEKIAELRHQRAIEKQNSPNMESVMRRRKQIYRGLVTVAISALFGFGIGVWYFTNTIWAQTEEEILRLLKIWSTH